MKGVVEVVPAYEGFPADAGYESRHIEPRRHSARLDVDHVDRELVRARSSVTGERHDRTIWDAGHPHKTAGSRQLPTRRVLAGGCRDARQDHVFVEDLDEALSREGGDVTGDLVATERGQLEGDGENGRRRSDSGRAFLELDRRSSAASWRGSLNREPAGTAIYRERWYPGTRTDGDSRISRCEEDGLAAFLIQHDGPVIGAKRGHFTALEDVVPQALVVSDGPLD